MLKIGGQRVPPRILLLVASDGILIVVGLLVAIGLRFLYLRLALAYLRGPQTVFRFAFVVVACLLALYYNDLYNPQVLRRRTELMVRLLQALGFACLGLAIGYYLDPDHSLGRGIAALAALTN